MKKKLIFRTVAVLCAIGCGFSAYKAVRIQRDYTQGVEEYEHLADILTSSADTSIYVSKNWSDSGEQAPIDVNFELLQEMNANAVGWLYSEGTLINYPVVQSTDNEYYLKHLFNDQTNSAGAIFMDAMNNPDLSNVNTIIYGHNMKNGTMFTSLMNYSTQWYFEQHPVLYYLTEEHDYRIDVFTSYETKDGSEAFTINFDSEMTYSNYLESRRNLSQINASHIPVSTEDNIITLATCGYNFSNSRYVVQGKVTQLN